jgi:hypothetical protein
VTGFLIHLAGLARGDVGAGAARAALPPRLAPELVDAPRSREGGGEAAPLPVASQPSAPQPAPLPAERQVLHAESTPAPSPSPIAPADQDPPPRRGRVTDRDARPVHHPDLRVPRPQAAKAAQPLANPPPAPTAPGRPLGLHFDAVIVPSVQQAGPPTGHPALAPLSEAAIASRVTTAQASRPVINVTVDRIDVRAAEAGKPGAAAVKLARRQPAMSLADYLRRERGGRA